jgi:hypothetical protein
MFEGVEMKQEISTQLAYLASFSEDDFSDASVAVASAMPNSISIQSNRFWLKSSEGEQEPPNPLKMNFVYLGGKKPVSRQYYAGAYDENNAFAPACMSYDGVVPEVGCDVPIVEATKLPANTCYECPMSKFGSAFSKKTGKPVPACRTHKDIVIKVMDIEGLWLLRIPPMSIPNWDSATKKLRQVIEAEKLKGSATPLSLGNCVFEAAFDTRGVMGILLFEPKGYVQGAELNKVVEYRKAPDDIEGMLWGPNPKARKAQYVASQKPSSVKPVASAMPPSINTETVPSAVFPNTAAVHEAKGSRPEGASSMDIDDILKAINNQ